VNQKHFIDFSAFKLKCFETWWMTSPYHNTQSFVFVYLIDYLFMFY